MLRRRSVFEHMSQIKWSELPTNRRTPLNILHYTMNSSKL